MSITLQPSKPTGGSSVNGSSRSPAGIVPAKRRQRSLPLAAVAVACMVGAIVAFVGIQLASSNRHPVLTVAHQVPAGATITASDLTVAEVASDPALKPIPLAAKSSVIGQRASVTLEPGTLLTAASIGNTSVVGNGQALVGIAVAPGAAPLDALAAGERVLVVSVAKADDTSAGSPDVLATGQIVRVDQSDSTGTASLSVSVAVPAAKAPAVAAASVAQRAALVVLP
jgi:hypothetical protein